MSVSGARVANAYKGWRNATAVTLERTTQGWTLREVRAAGIWNDGGGDELYLPRSSWEKTTILDGVILV